MKITRDNNKIEYVKGGDYFVRLDRPPEKGSYRAEIITVILIAAGIVGFCLIPY
jgi:hypothetical protein